MRYIRSGLMVMVHVPLYSVSMCACVRACVCVCAGISVWGYAPARWCVCVCLCVWVWVGVRYYDRCQCLSSGVFSVAGACLWNRLLVSVKSANSLEIFKSLLKTDLFKVAVHDPYNSLSSLCILFCSVFECLC